MEKARKLLYCWLVLAMLLCGAVTEAVAQIQKTVYGNGKVTSQELPLQTFDKLAINGQFEVVLKPGSAEALRIEAEENLIGLITAEVKNGELLISSKKSARPNKPMKLYLTVRSLSHIDLNGSVVLKGESKLTGTNLHLDLSGASHLALDIDINTLTTDISGSSTLQLKGQTAAAGVESSGSSTIEASELIAENMKINMNGASHAKVNASKELTVKVAGAASISYKGRPNVKQEISGAGSIRPM